MDQGNLATTVQWSPIAHRSFPRHGPPATPHKIFSREEIVNEVLDLTDQVAFASLLGPTDVGKSSVALTRLHHDRTKVKFGGNCHFMRRENLTNPRRLRELAVYWVIERDVVDLYV